MGEGCRVVQNHGTIVFFTAAHTSTYAAAAAAATAAASCHAPLNYHDEKKQRF